MATLAEKRENRFRRRGEAEAEKQRQSILKRTKILRRLLEGLKADGEMPDEIAIKTLECVDLIEELFKGETT